MLLFIIYRYSSIDYAVVAMFFRQIESLLAVACQALLLLYYNSVIASLLVSDDDVINGCC
jgi:apolipoprotein N-acyltransferase